jgi:histone H3/H4
MKEVSPMEGEVLVIASKVRSYLKDKGVKMSGELVNELSDKVKSLLDSAAARTKANKRSTVKPQDL